MEKGEKRKGNNGSEPKVNCVTRRVRFLCSGQKSRSCPRGVKKQISGSSLARVCGDWRREGRPNLRETSCELGFGLFPLPGAISRMCSGGGGAISGNARGPGLFAKMPRGVGPFPEILLLLAWCPSSTSAFALLRFAVHNSFEVFVGVPDVPAAPVGVRLCWWLVAPKPHVNSSWTWVSRS